MKNEETNSTTAITNSDIIHKSMNIDIHINPTKTLVGTVSTIKYAYMHCDSYVLHIFPILDCSCVCW